jgi:hypothetical protein
MMPSKTRRVCWGLIVLTGFAFSTARAEEGWAEKMFDKTTHDFGTVARGAKVTHRFRIKNIYKETVHIREVRTTCGCSAGKPSKRTLESLETGYIEATMNTTRFTRRKDSNLIVVFDQPSYAEVRIPVTAYIRTDVVLTPGGAEFGAVEAGKPAERKIEVAYAGRSDWTIKEVKSDSKYVDAKVVETSREGGSVNYDLFVSLKDNAPVGPLREQIVLVTDDANGPKVPVIVEARVEADFTVTPSVVSLGTLTPGTPKTVNVVVRGREPFAIEKIECESDRELFKVRLSKSKKPVHVLPLTIMPPDEAGKFSEEFTVTIAGRKETVTFAAKGAVAP